MKVDFLSQAAKHLKEQKQYRRRAVVFLCLAVIVGYGTVMALKLYGQAMTHKMEVLDCQYAVHAHTDECYETDEEGNPGTEPVCGYAEYVLHIHNDTCYDKDGNTVCTLEEHEPHEHTEECFVTERILVCGEEAEADNAAGAEDMAGSTPQPGETADGTEASGDGAEGTEASGDGADGTGASEDTSGSQEQPGENGDNPAGNTGEASGAAAPENTETPDSAAEPTPEPEGGAESREDEIVCGKEAHSHNENCYENALNCGYEEEHTHNADCIAHELSCGAAEHVHGEECHDADGNVVCTMEEHSHTDSCYNDSYTCGKEEHMHSASCNVQNLICGMEEHAHEDACHASAGGPVELSETGTGTEADGTEAGSTASGETGMPEEAGAPEESAAPEEGRTTGHVHTDACYMEVTIPVCGEQEFHIHDDSCYTEECFDGEGNLIEGSRVSCGMLQLEEHTHGEACIKTVELTPEEVAALNNGAKLHIHEDSCYDEEGILICGHEATHIHVLECYDEAGELICGYGTASHVHEDKCYDAAGGLICGYETATHVHEDSCYDAEGNRHCGYDTAAHGHEAGCYDAEGSLVCGYETASHPHEADCYDREGNLTCGYETATHIHEDKCYDEEGNLICGYEAASHLHRENCYDEEGNLVCGYETAKHFHEDSCYDEEGNLICGYEDAKEHEHDGRCYDEEGNLICGKEAKDHEHAVHCYDKEGNLVCGYEGVRDHEHDSRCYDAEGSLLCGFEGAREHEHDGTCRDGEGNLTCGYENCSIHEHDAGCYDIYDALICGYEGAENHVHTENCYNEEGNLACGYEVPDEYANSKIFKGNGYTVIAKYNDDAQLPEEARFIAEEITADSDKEHYERRETEYREMTDNEEASIRALLKIGFYIESEDGLTEVEPAAPVIVSVQFLDEDGLPEGSPVTVVHFAKEGTEVLDGGSAVDNSTTFEMGSFSEIAIGYIEKEDPRGVNTAGDGTIRLHLADSFEYKDSAFQIIFHVEGEAILPKGTVVRRNPQKNSQDIRPGEGGAADEAAGAGGAEADSEEITEEETSAEGEEIPEGDVSADVEETTEADASEETEDEAVTDNEEESEAEGEFDTAVPGEEIPAEGEGESEENGSYVDIRKLKFKVERLSSESEEYRAFLEHTLSGTGIDELYRMQVLNYSLTYEGEELDLSECKVTVEIRPARELQEAMGQSVTDGVDYLLNTEGETSPDEVEYVPDAVSYSTEFPGEDVSAGDAETGAEAEEGEGMPFEENGAGQDEESTSEQTEAVPQSGTEGANPAVGNGTDAISLTVMTMAQDGPADLDQVDFDGTEDVVLEAELTGSQIFAASATGYPNPKYTVQYYANLEKVAFNDETLKENIDAKNTNELPVIDTDGGKLPKNGGGKDNSPNENAIRKLYVDTKTGKLKTTTELTEVYAGRNYEYHKAPTINYINALIENTSYELKELWVLKEGKDPKSTAEGDWDIYQYNEKLHFTNREVSGGVEGSETYVYIKDGNTLRLVYDTTTKEKDFQAAFYDYDIGDGKIYAQQSDAQNGNNGKPTSTQGTGTWYMRTGQQGINSPGNYTKPGVKFAFGNANTGSGLQHEQWNGNLLNKNNTTQGGHPTVIGSYKGCTFGLAASLVNGKIQYADGVIVPNLFNDGAGTGKTAYDNNEYSLKFNRVGDTHTLTAVNGTKTGNLDSFNHPSPNKDTVHNHIWTNNFWPMDFADSYGTNGHDMKFGDYGRRTNYKFAGQAGSSGGSATATGDFPWSDDGKDHNSYFGMHYKVEFDLVADYTGPLEYYFFGDDDMWVFLGNGDGNGKLVCDIGGVHSSVGEYLNLWDYIDKEKEKIHRHDEKVCYGNGIDQAATCGYVDSKKFTLNFFYTERGESGSTCWMQFTLPSVSSLTPETTDSDYGHLRVEKDVMVRVDGEDYSPEEVFGEEAEQTQILREKEFKFKLTLQGPNGSSLKDDYAYVKYDRNGNVVSDGGGILAWETIANGEEFTLKDGEYIRIQYLPKGAKYTVTELDDTGIEGVVYEGTVTEHRESEGSTDPKVGNDKKVEGFVPENGTGEIRYINIYSTYTLPETGGSGKNLYTIAGGIVLLLGAGFLYKKKFRERRA